MVFDRNMSPGRQLFIFLFLTLGVALFTYLLGMLLAVPIFGLSMDSLQNELTSSDGNINLLVYLQFISQLGVFVFPPIIFILLMKKSLLGYFQLNHLASFRTFFYVFLVAFTILPVINIIASWNQQLQLPEFLSGMQSWMEQKELAAEEITRRFLSRTSYEALIMNLVVIALIPAIGEELFFRGVIQKVFSEWFKNAHIAILVTAILFSALHMQFFGFLPRMVLGLLFGYYFYWTKSLWVPIVAHFINNGGAVIVAFKSARGEMNMDYEDFGSYNGNTTLILLNLALTVFMLFFIYRQEVLRKRG